MISSKCRQRGAPHTPRRAALSALAILGVWLTLADRGNAQSAEIPPSVQAAFMAKLASFDRNFAARAGARANVIVVSAPGDAQSSSEATRVKMALSELPTVGNLPHAEHSVTYSTAADLVNLVHQKQAAIVYFASGLSSQMPAIRSAFSSLNVITFGAVPDYVPAGIVLGIDLVSGRPKILINLTQAEKQQVSVAASVLKLMKVYR